MGSVKQKIEIEIEVTEGYEVIDFRPPLNDELFLSDSDFKTVLRATYDFTTPKFILRKVKRYREPVLPADLGKVCEFSDNETHWFEGNLIGLITTDYGIRWQRAVGLYQRCRIEVADD